MLRIAVPDLVSNSYFPIIAAVELGFFKSEGFDASVDLLFPVPKTFEALRDGQLDFVVGSAHATLLAFPDWKGAKLLCAIAKHTYWFLVIRSDLNPKRGDLSVVKGLRIGAAPGVNLSLQRLLIEAGIDPEKNNVQIVPIPGRSRTECFLRSLGGEGAGRRQARWLLGQRHGLRSRAPPRRRQRSTGCSSRRRASCGTELYFLRACRYGESHRKRPDSARAAIRAIMKAHKALKEDVSRATEVGKKRFPPSEAELIAELIRRDLPYYDPTITEETVTHMNRFAQDIGLLSAPVPYDQVVATQFASSLEEPV